MTKPLLPIGFYDLLGEQAIINHRNINQILEVFFSAGYQLIKTPLLEFAENFSAENLANNFYSLEKVEQNKIKQDYIKIGESEKSKKTFNKFLQKYSSNPEIKKFFYDFYFNLQNYKKPKSSWSFFKK